MKRIAFCVFILVAVLISCVKHTVNPVNCIFNPCSFVAPASEVQEVQDYLTANNITAAQHCSGMFYRIEGAGGGKTPTICSTISVRYTARLTNGNIFDQHDIPVTFNLSSLLPAWKIGLPLIHSGGRIVMFVPPYLGYGSQEVRDTSGNVIIPSHSILLFEIDLASVD